MHVVRVDRDSAAFEADIRPGDVILSLNGTPIHLPEDFVSQIKANAGKSVSLGLERNGTDITKVVTVPSMLKSATSGLLGMDISQSNSQPSRYLPWILWSRLFLPRVLLLALVTVFYFLILYGILAQKVFLLSVFQILLLFSLVAALVMYMLNRNISYILSAGESASFLILLWQFKKGLSRKKN